MKKIMVVFICILFLQIGLFQISNAKDVSKNQINVSFHISAPSLYNDENYTRISLNESHFENVKPGHPAIPCLKDVEILPFGSRIENITYYEKNTRKITIEKSVKPYQTPQPISKQQDVLPVYKMDEAIYHKNSLYPEVPFRVTTNTGQHQGTQVTFLTIEYYPIRYNPVDQRIIWSESCEISISIKQDESETAFSNPFDLIIICPENFKKDLIPLASHKQEVGLTTSIKTIEDIYQEDQGRDEAEQIKYFLYNTAKNQGVKSVLVVGNVNLVPMRRSAIDFYNEEDILTDLYYADIFDGNGEFSSWDTNENNLFSEYSWSEGQIDYVDAYPDFSIGRLPCKNTKEVKTVVDKIINYEKNTAQQPWFSRLILMGGDTFPNHGVLEGEVVTELIAGSMKPHSFQPIRLWTSSDTFNPLMINKEISKGAGFISYSGHGYEQGFGTSPPNIEQRIQYYSPYLIGLFNNNKLPIIFFDACSTTKLDFTVEDSLYWYPEPLARLFTFLEGDSFEMDTLFPCFSWQLVKKQIGGSIGTIGATRVAFTGVSETGPHWGAGYLNVRFFENYVPGKTFGELFNKAQIDYLNSIGKDLITIEEFNLIGDPSLMIGGY